MSELVAKTKAEIIDDEMMMMIANPLFELRVFAPARLVAARPAQGTVVHCAPAAQEHEEAHS